MFLAIFNFYLSFDTKTEQEELEEEMVRKIVQKVVAANAGAVTEEKCKNWIDYLYYIIFVLNNPIHFYQDF